jgi:hypothetical protein
VSSSESDVHCCCIIRKWHCVPCFHCMVVTETANLHIFLSTQDFSWLFSQLQKNLGRNSRVCVLMCVCVCVRERERYGVAFSAHELLNASLCLCSALQQIETFQQTSECYIELSSLRFLWEISLQFESWPRTHKINNVIFSFGLFPRCICQV